MSYRIDDVCMAIQRRIGELRRRASAMGISPPDPIEFPGGSVRQRMCALYELARHGAPSSIARYKELWERHLDEWERRWITRS